MNTQEIEDRLAALEFVAAASLANFATTRWASSWNGETLPEKLKDLSAARNLPYPTNAGAKTAIDRICQQAIKLYPIGD